MPAISTQASQSSEARHTWIGDVWGADEWPAGQTLLRLAAPQSTTPPARWPDASLLSAHLRTHTAPLHAAADDLLRLPYAIGNRDDYTAWLGRFLGLYQPIERALATFQDWHTLGIVLAARNHAGPLRADLLALGIDPRTVPPAPAATLPALPTFTHALGALYVLEGATLGGQVILRDLEPRIGPPIHGATHFFGGRAKATGPLWQAFRAALDTFDAQHPHRREDVVAGADRTFRSILTWFEPFCAGQQP